MSYTRRRFLHRALGAGATLAIGSGPARGDDSESDDIVESKDSLAGGELVRHEEIIRRQRREIGDKAAACDVLPSLVVNNLILILKAQDSDEFSTCQRVLRLDDIVSFAAVAPCRSIADGQRSAGAKCPVQ